MEEEREAVSLEADTQIINSSNSCMVATTVRTKQRRGIVRLLEKR